jgi:beta-lactamase class D
MPAERQFVQRFQYGNADTSGGIDETGNPFWVDGSLRISADEQVEFLRRFYEARLGLSERTTRLTKEIMVAQDTSNWYVGYVEKAGTVYYFALQMGATDYGRAYSERIPITRAILTELGILN